MTATSSSTTDDAAPVPAIAGAEQSKELRRLQRQLLKLERDYNALVLKNEQAERMRKVSAAAQERTDFYNRLLLRSTPVSIFMLDRELNLILASDFAVRRLGYDDLQQLVGLHFPQCCNTVFPEHFICDLSDELRQTLSSGEARDFIAEATRLDGSDFVYHIAMRSVRDSAGDCKGVIAVSSDITELVQARNAAESASRAKSEFLSTISHEMRTPLNAIIGMSTVGLTSDDPQRKQHSLQRIVEASRRLLSVVSDVLDMSQIESGRLTLTEEDFCLRECLEQVRTDIATAASEKRQQLTLWISPQVPERLYGDATRLGQVLAHLVSNAVKFTPEGGRVSIAVDRAGREEGVAARSLVTPAQADAPEAAATLLLEFTVADTGIGIADEQRELLFQPFAQLDSSTTRRYGGTGLGLALARRIVELMGGSITVHSVVGQGSTFSFTARLGLVPDACDDSASAAALPDYSAYTVLLAKDNEINREVIIALLEPTGLKFDWASDGVQAVEAFLRDPTRYDLILMDMQMPELDGLEATRQIRTSGRPGADSLPIIALTANVFQEDIERCLESGMNDHVGKPVDFNLICQKLDRYLLAQ
ncbi:MAG: response regulator [Coriobacteriales bacterium]|jgi:PAS domain S-box-containing protein|nr:response regulator [Coriobacteriales bacterium]